MFKPGDRVVIRGHWEFDDGITGTVRLPSERWRSLAQSGEWEGACRTVQGRKGQVVMYVIEFDEPQDDGSGDGPYRGAEIEQSCLRSLNQDSGT